MVRVCPRCQTRYATDKFNTDFEHVCNSGDEALDEESILVIGPWVDYTGSNPNVKSTVSQYGGIENQFWGTRAGIEGANLESLDVRGKSKTRYRSRQHLEFIDLKDEKK